MGAAEEMQTCQISENENFPLSEVDMQTFFEWQFIPAASQRTELSLVLLFKHGWLWEKHLFNPDLPLKFDSEMFKEGDGPYNKCGEA